MQLIDDGTMVSPTCVCTDRSFLSSFVINSYAALGDAIQAHCVYPDCP